MRRRLWGAGSAAAVLLLAVAGPALAHVTTDPDSAPKGGEITLGFRVPNEETSATTTRVEFDFPSDHPLLGVDPQAEPGWTDTIVTRTLNPPIQTDDGPVTEAVSQVVWTGGAIAPGHFSEFHVLVQQLPKDADQVVFKAVQTYSNGDVVRWIDPVVPGQPGPDHPTPILTLTAAVQGSHGATKSSVTTARTLAIVALVVAALGLALAALAVMRRPGT
jgi:uncharacterized protein YcnI